MLFSSRPQPPSTPWLLPMYFPPVYVLFISLFVVSTASETATSLLWLTADFWFNWTPPGVNVSVPTTAQCDKINITWTPRDNGGQDPVAPYHLQVYTSTMTYPVIVDAGRTSPFAWTVPFAPDTQYQICMFDSEGHSGGCQDKYTVIPPRNTTRGCNATFTTPNTLSVQGVTETGPLTQYGWPDQCTAISLKAQNGTPPYIMTVAPSLHPPLNLTFNDNGPMNWTITLGWGMQYWLSVVDSLGASWAYGPLHSGGNGPTDCLHLAGNSLVTRAEPSSHRISPGAAVGIAIGSFGFGIVITLAVQLFASCIRRITRNEGNNEDVRAMTNASSRIVPYPVESTRSQTLANARPDGVQGRNNALTSGEQNDSQVYVVHHDAGGAPVTIFTGGRDVQELPPHYDRTSSEPQLNRAQSHLRLTHTPATSLDSATNTSDAARSIKTRPSLRAVSN